MQEKIIADIQASIGIKTEVSQTLVPQIEKAAKLMIETLRSGNKVLFCGNGGSAADAQHLAGELVGRFLKERRALPAIALSTDTSILTCLANDYSFDIVFARQVEALARSRDVVFGLSTSGNSKNVLEAFKKAKERECQTIGLLGGDGGQIAKLSDIAIIVPSKATPRVQESHIMIGHILCALIEDDLFPEK
ncbi:MAG: D-sedoheptulose 7-phosphate isomerase [Candidatus Margulisbacteria bacterium]|nr:D-sedoheptulose 7-phosphate isomerase [Candidatus Margulisiibacteriota bacterium]